MMDSDQDHGGRNVKLPPDIGIELTNGIAVPGGEDVKMLQHSKAASPQRKGIGEVSEDDVHDVPRAPPLPSEVPQRDRRLGTIFGYMIAFSQDLF